jgi:hypothetical protein
VAGRRSERPTAPAPPRPTIERSADRAALREGEVRDHAIEAIDEAVTRFRADLRATKRIVHADGTITEEPLIVFGPRDLALLIDRFQVLFGRPSTISEGRGFAATVTSQVPVEVLKGIVEATRELAPSQPVDTSGLPRIRERRPD